MKETKTLIFGSDTFGIMDEKARPVLNVATMKSMKTLIDGDVIRTLGYHTPGDGGSGLYLIKTRTGEHIEDNGSIHFVGDGLIAELMIENSTINVKQFGAIGDGETDDYTYINNAINFLKPGMTLMFPNTESYYRVKTFITISDKKDIVIENAKIHGVNNEGVDLECVVIINNFENITFENCYFYEGNQVLLIHTGSNLKINKCNFERTGYAIIQQMGYVSNNVIITNCYAKHLKRDFIECNCELNAKSKNWVVANNIYDGVIDMTNVIENRFLGATYLDGLTIENNVVENATGTAGIHLEDPYGNVLINGNILKNCLTYGCITIQDASAKNVLISNNIFENNIVNNDDPMIYIYNIQSPEKTNISIDGNKFIGNGVQSNPISWNDIQNYRGLVINNTFKGFDYFTDSSIASKRTCNIDFISNKIECNKLFNYNESKVNSGLWSLNFISNLLKCDIDLTNDKNGTSAHSIVFSDCFIDGNVNIKNAKDIILKNNTIANGKTITFEANSYYAERMYAYNNYILRTGFNSSDNRGGQ